MTQKGLKAKSTPVKQEEMGTKYFVRLEYNSTGDVLKEIGLEPPPKKNEARKLHC